MWGSLVRLTFAVLLCALLVPAAASARIAFTRTDKTLGYAPQDIAIANLDRKRGPDIVIADESNGAVRIYLNKGNGKFRGPSSMPACDAAREVVIGKLNQGPALDLLVDCGGRNFGAVTLLGNGTGGFSAAKNAGSGVYPLSGLSLGHINGPRGGLDVAFNGFTQSGGGIVCHAIGKNNGTFRDQTCAQDPSGGAYTVTSGGPIALADLSGDAGLEAMTFVFDGIQESVAFFPWSIRDYPRTGFGPYPSFHRTRSTYGVAIRAVDLDRDGIRDVVTGESRGKLSVLKIRRRSVDQAKLFAVAPVIDDMALGDFNRDRKLDAASISPIPIGSPTSPLGSVRINTGNGNATFDTPSKRFPAGLNGGTHRLAVGDLNRDGRADIAVVEYATGKLSLLLSR